MDGIARTNLFVMLCTLWLLVCVIILKLSHLERVVGRIRWWTPWAVWISSCQSWCHQLPISYQSIMIDDFTLNAYNHVRNSDKLFQHCIHEGPCGCWCGACILPQSYSLRKQKGKSQDIGKSFCFDKGATTDKEIMCKIISKVPSWAWNVSDNKR